MPTKSKLQIPKPARAEIRSRLTSFICTIADASGAFVQNGAAMQAKIVKQFTICTTLQDFFFQSGFFLNQTIIFVQNIEIIENNCCTLPFTFMNY
ncbi:hypothetical protein C7N43_30815 [Sphingobacteriales bacterium UPWRP_1]|nr:hypothetical protein B6N25_09860 [Sphingobacteriales bacterium TSM_CSS]PSJ73118.1 hypothetical protein C7N43_30815 [Sphingobacteriales bacterium UPWRP_1]